MFFKKRIFKSDEQKAAEALPRTKKVQFMPQKLGELAPLLENDLSVLTTLEPVNYYASKDEFLQCTFYFKEDYSEVYFNIEYFRFDRAESTTKYFKADYELMKKTLRKFGQQI